MSMDFRLIWATTDWEIYLKGGAHVLDTIHTSDCDCVQCGQRRCGHKAD